MKITQVADAIIEHPEIHWPTDTAMIDAYTEEENIEPVRPVTTVQWLAARDRYEAMRDKLINHLCEAPAELNACIAIINDTPYLSPQARWMSQLTRDR